MPTNITIIEDDQDILKMLRYQLQQSGYTVAEHRDGAAGLDAVKRDPPDLLLLDLMLPGLDGLEICRQLRASDRTVALPIIMLSSKDRQSDIILGLGLGADDYLTKPFELAELEARIKSVLRRAALGRRSAALVRFGDLTVDLDSFTARLADKPLTLTRTELRMLHVLAGSPGRAFTRDMLKDLAIADDVYIVDHNIDVHIAALRKKLGGARHLIETVWGVGYRFAQEL